MLMRVSAELAKSAGYLVAFLFLNVVIAVIPIASGWAIGSGKAFELIKWCLEVLCAST